MADLISPEATEPTTGLETELLFDTRCDGVTGSAPATEAPPLSAFSRRDSFAYDNELELVDEGYRLISTERPFLPDSRERILQTEARPYRWICQLLIDFSDGKYVGTGTLVGPRHVLTAAHNLYHLSDKRKALHVTCVPGRRGDETPFTPLWGGTDQFSIAEGYTDGDISKDYAMVYLPPRLAAGIGQQIGYITRAVVRPDALSKLDRDIFIVGYAEDKDKDRGRFQWGARNRIEYADELFIWYTLDTGQGQSGSPIYVENGGSFVQIGIHTRYEGKYNRGIRLSRENDAVIQGWLARSQ